MPKWSPRNPLEVIAIFLAFIYGIFSLLLGTAVGTLSLQNQTTMIYFIVGYPILVLVVFAWLVRNHHAKLYAPGDYRSDDAFHGRPAPSESLGEKFKAEASVSLPDDQGTKLQPLSATPPAENARRTTPAAKVAKIQSAATHISSESVQSAYLAEGLAFLELQKEFDASVRRHISIGTPSGESYEVDGLLETTANAIVVEIKLIGRTQEVERRVRETIATLDNFRTAGPINGKPVVCIPVFIASDDRLIPRIAEAVQTQQERAPLSISARIFSLDNLTKKYGFDAPDKG